MMQARSVGIVTRTKERPLLLRRALESVRAQTYRDWTLVVVNDAGDPAPVEALRQEIFGDDPRVKIVHREVSHGADPASNAGLACLETDTAILHDDDDSWAPEFLETALGELNRQSARFPSIRGVATGVVAVFERIQGARVVFERDEPWHADRSRPLEEGFLDLHRMLERNCFPPIAFLFDLGAARELGLYDESLPVLGDWEFQSRFAIAHDIWVCPRPMAFYHHRRKETGAMGNTVIAGIASHRLHGKAIRNRWARDLLQARPADRALLAEVEKQRVMLGDLATKVDKIARNMPSRPRRRYIFFGPKT